jgi:hypothetical protein
MNVLGESRSTRKGSGVKLALVGAGAVLSAITLLGLHHLDVDQLNPHSRLGM